MKLGVVGLGSMGYGIAASLLRAGHGVCGSDVNAEAMLRLQAEGGQSAKIAEAAPGFDALVLVVLNAAQVEAVLFGAEALATRLPKGAVVICCVTVAPEFARRMAAQCEALGLLYLDAPISGGSVKAAKGKLTVMASGSAAAFAAARPMLEATAEKVFDLGSSAGMGSAMKAVNQMLAGVHIAAMAEAVTFGITQGIAPETFLKVIPDCAGTSWMLENRAPHIVAGDYTPHSAVDIWPKDLGIVLDAARSANFVAPLTAAALQQFVAASSMGFGRQDDAAVAKVYASNAGLSLPGET
jgi:L-threonate 2-dehydrogenase